MSYWTAGRSPILLALACSALAGSGLRIKVPASATPLVAAVLEPAPEDLRDALSSDEAAAGCSSYRTAMERAMCSAEAAQALRAR